MEAITNLAAGMTEVLKFTNLFYCFLGVTLGTFIGVMPGLGAMLGIALLLPITFYLTPETAIIMVAGIYYGGEYGGSIASILINVPGTPSSAVACIDGNPMTRQGRGAVALFSSAVASFIGGSVGIALMSLFSPLIARFAMTFTSVDYFAVLFLGLIGSTSVARGSKVKAIVAVIFGVLFGTIGTDVSTGVQRFIIGFNELITGVSLVVLAMGIFGFAEVVFSTSTTISTSEKPRIRMRDMLPTRLETRRSILPIGRGTALGSLLGALPGTGPTIASFMAYAMERRLSRQPQRMGHGAIEGLVAPEAANNAAAQTAFIPTLTLGIPGTATMALILGALMIHGIPPGPELMTKNADLFWALVASFWIGNVILLCLNIPLVGVWVRLVHVPYRFLFPTIICLICIGVYSINRSTFEIFAVLAMGLMGYLMRITRFEAAPFLMGFILGPLMEENLRRGMLLARGDFMVFVKNPISATCIAIAFFMLVLPIIVSLSKRLRIRRRSRP